MIFSIPIFIEERAGDATRGRSFLVRPLFRDEPRVRAEKLSRALSKLGNELHSLLRELGREPRHDDLAAWTFHPLLEETTLEVRLELASGSHRRTFFVVGYPALGRKLHFTPSLNDLHFEVLPGQILAERLTEVLTRRFRELERERGVDLDDFALAGKGRLTTIEVELEPAALGRTADKPARALIFGGEEHADGEQELRRTGRALNAMYPDDLDRAVGRDREVEELAGFLAASDRRPILLVGPRKVGKTAILHELAWQIAARKKERFGGGRELWLVSPMRLISGMSFLGQWENRVLAILKHAGEKDRVLYFDDLLGLFTAGVSAASNLNVAQVLKPWLERLSVRVIAEISPEAWRVLRERDRALADLFHVIPVPEPSEAETLRVLVAISRQLEQPHRCRFGLEVVPAVYELHRRFAGEAAFPGKAAGFLRRLAIRQAGEEVTRTQVLHEFHLQSGLQAALLDERAVIDRRAILDQLQQGVVGQDHALHAFADLLVTVKARLNDPHRPLGTFLLLGPTGVGKTQAAKTLAEFLFASGERLLRFDMNEYVDSAAAARLAGTPREPEGLLTSAIRRQPFSVLLFDEIEKAAPEVFDLLLAVLDEGRLTDALGRVADFTQSVILLTSNLGAREARSRLGFGAGTPDTAADDALYVEAAEKFFRPEFFNRLDRILPFRALDRARLEGIARQLLDGVLGREGLRCRHTLLSVTPAAMTRLVELGHHPQLGARALKRVMEREVAQPLAEKLCALPPGTPTMANLDVRGDGFALAWRDLTPVPQSVFWPESMATVRTGAAQSTWLTGLLDGVYAALNRIEAALEPKAPAGRVEWGHVAPEHAHYFFCRECVKRVERLAQAVERARVGPRRLASPTSLPRPKPVKVVLRQIWATQPSSNRKRDAVQLQHNLDDLEDQLTEVADSPVNALVRELALLETLASHPAPESPLLLVFRARTAVDRTAMLRFARAYAEGLASLGHGSATPLPGRSPREAKTPKSTAREPSGRTQAILLQATHARCFLPADRTTILTRHADGQVGLVLMTVEEFGSETEARRLAKRLDAGIDTLAPDDFGPVMHLIHENRTLTDFRTGLVVPAEPSVEEMRALLLSALQLPQELGSFGVQGFRVQGFKS